MAQRIRRYKCTNVLDHQNDSEVLGMADTGDECPPLHSLDSFDEKNRPTSASNWCGWSTSSFEISPAGGRCVWKSKIGRSSDVKLEGVQTEISSHIQKAQAIWIAPDECTWSKASSPIPGQEHLSKPLLSAEDWLGTSICSNGKQQSQGGEPLSAAERSMRSKHNDGIGFGKEALRIIHEESEFEVQQTLWALDIIGNTRDTWLWRGDFMKPNQCSQGTAAGVKWTNVDYLSCFLTATSLPKEVPIMHMRKSFNPLVNKVAPAGNLQGQIPYTEGLTNMEPNTLWRKLLLREHEEYAFSGTQVRVCMGQQPGALNGDRIVQPLLATGLGKKATFQDSTRTDNPSWFPFEEVAFTGDTLQASDELRSIDDTKKSIDNTAKHEERVQFHTALRPAVYCKLALALAKNAGRSRKTEEQ